MGRLANLTNPKEERLLTLLTEIAERPAIDQNTTISALQALKAVAGNSNARDLFATQVDGVIGNLANLIEKHSGGGTTRTRDSVVDLQVYNFFVVNFFNLFFRILSWSWPLLFLIINMHTIKLEASHVLSLAFPHF